MLPRLPDRHRRSRREGTGPAESSCDPASTFGRRIGLPAARRYALAAPASYHARHMPAHIFTMLGLWEESIRANRESNAVIDPEHAGDAVGGDIAALHEFDFIVYARLQQAQDRWVAADLTAARKAGQAVTLRAKRPAVQAVAPREFPNLGSRYQMFEFPEKVRVIVVAPHGGHGNARRGNNGSSEPPHDGVTSTWLKHPAAVAGSSRDQQEAWSRPGRQGIVPGTTWLHVNFADNGV